MIQLIRHPNLTLADDELCDKLCAQTFGNDQDPEQAAMEDWDFEGTKKFPYSWTVICKNNIFAGYTFVLPCNEDLMHLFLNRTITERELSNRIKKEIDHTNYNTIYLISSVILPEYERQGLAIRSIMDSVEKMNEQRQARKLFTWPFTQEAAKLSNRASEYFAKKGYEFYTRSNQQ